MFELNIIRACLLQTYFGIFCGSQNLSLQAELIHGTLVTACKRMYLLRPGYSAVRALLAQNALASTAEQKRALAEDDERERLGWAIYVRECSVHG